jgi:hypothetical protein
MSAEGAQRITRERQRQIQQEGWSNEIDDGHTDGELAWAAVCYAAPERVYTLNQGVTPKDPVIAFHDPWPRQFDPTYDKRPSYKRVPSTKKRIRALEKAGALIAAEIDRLLRVVEEEKSDESPRVPS